MLLCFYKEAKMQITKKEFIKMYDSMSNTEMADSLGVTTMTIHTWARKLKLPLKKSKKLIKDD